MQEQQKNISVYLKHESVNSTYNMPFYSYILKASVVHNVGLEMFTMLNGIGIIIYL